MSYDEIVAINLDKSELLDLRRGPRTFSYFLNPNGSVDDLFFVLDEDHNNLIDKEGGIVDEIQAKLN